MIQKTGGGGGGGGSSGGGGGGSSGGGGGGATGGGGGATGGGGGAPTGPVGKPTTTPGGVPAGTTSIEQSISNQFKSKLTTTTTTTTTTTASAIPKLVKANTNCDPIQESIKLGPTIIPPKGLLILASTDKCRIKQGTVIVDIPRTPNLKLLAGNFDKSQIVLVNATNLQNIPSGTTTGNTTISSVKLGKLATSLVGKDIQTGAPKSVSTINGAVLWNAGGFPIKTTEANNAEVVITFTK